MWWGVGGAQGWGQEASKGARATDSEGPPPLQAMAFQSTMDVFLEGGCSAWLPCPWEAPPHHITPQELEDARGPAWLGTTWGKGEGPVLLGLEAWPLA